MQVFELSQTAQAWVAIATVVAMFIMFVRERYPTEVVAIGGVAFLLFMIGEYFAIVLMCALTALLFFGGWLSPIPGLPDGFLWFLLKIIVVFFVFALTKAVVPRYRYDQLMRLGWKIFLPTSLVAVVLVSGWRVAVEAGLI